MNDHKGQPLAIGDRVIPVHWGEIPLWLCNTNATVVGFGRKRVQLRFDGVSYSGTDKPHTCSPDSLRRL